MARLVPDPPLLTIINRRMARLPLGGPTGLACAAAGFACVIGLFVIGPSVAPRSFRADEAIAPRTAVIAMSPDRKPGATPKPAKARIDVVLAVVKTSPSRAAGPAAPPSSEAPPATPEPPSDPPAAVAPIDPSPEPNRSAERREDRGDDDDRERDRRRGSDDDDREDDDRRTTDDDEDDAEREPTPGSDEDDPS